MFLFPHIAEARPVLGKVFKKRILGYFESFGRVGCLVLHTARLCKPDYTLTMEGVDTDGTVRRFTTKLPLTE